MHSVRKPVRIAVVDDHPVARYGMGLIFASEPDLDIVCMAASVAELGEMRNLPDVVILDLYMAGGRVPDAEIAAIALRRPVLVVSASAREADVLSAIRAGACGYVTKSSSSAVFLEAVRTVAAGTFFVSPQLADIVHAQAEGAPGECPAGRGPALAPREKETLSLIAQGFTQAQAAARMGVSAATVDTYIKRIRSKLGPGNKAHLTRLAMELGEEGCEPVPPTTGTT